MDFGVTNEQKEFLASFKIFLDTVINDEKKTFEEKWIACAEYGLFGIPYEAIYGGIDEQYVTAAMMMQELGYICNDSGFAFCITNHIWACLNSIYHYGSKVLKGKYVSSLISGHQIGALALTESESGSDFLSINTNARVTEEGYIINGHKSFISNCPIADIFIVSARTGNKGDLNSISCFVCEKNTPGLIVMQESIKMGLETCPMSDVVFKDVFIPKENILGKWGNGIKVLNGIMEWERCFEFAVQVGTMKRIMEESIKYSKIKKKDCFQAITHKIAKMKINIELAENMMYKIAWLKDQKKSTFLESSIFKHFVSESYVQASLDMLQIFGAYGYTSESGIEKDVRDALSSKIYAGSSEIQLNVIYRLIKYSVLMNRG